MLGLFITLGIAILTLLVILFWFVPHLLQQQAERSASETAHLREMLFDMLNEQEVVTLRQGQLGTSVSYLQDQLEQHKTLRQNPHTASRPDAAELYELEQRVVTLQHQIENHLESYRERTEQDNESWMHLLGLLAAIQERIGELSTRQETISQEKIS
jgi:Na+/phosphate symporter